MKSDDYRSFDLNWFLIPFMVLWLIFLLLVGLLVELTSLMSRGLSTLFQKFADICDQYPDSRLFGIPRPVDKPDKIDGNR